jgi:hypothetical protein
MPGAPVALDEPPCSGDVDGVPRVPEAVVFGGLAVALDDDAVETGKAEIFFA